MPCAAELLDVRVHGSEKGVIPPTPTTRAKSRNLLQDETAKPFASRTTRKTADVLCAVHWTNEDFVYIPLRYVHKRHPPTAARGISMTVHALVDVLDRLRDLCASQFITRAKVGFFCQEHTLLEGRLGKSGFHCDAWDAAALTYMSSPEQWGT